MEKILIIDDVPEVLDSIRFCLQDFGYEVTAACNGHEGISLFDKEPKFDLVITDIKMPRLGGYEVAKHIRNSDRPHTPILGITGFSEANDQDSFDHILLKPFNLKSFVKIIETLINFAYIKEESRMS